jgi:DsbC/DsbD-like thiol-disulfide interchange protein
MMDAGGSTLAPIRISIDPGYHINANPPTYPYLKATQLELRSAPGISVGRIIYPTPMTRKFAFAEKPLSVYEGETQLMVTVKTDKTVHGTNNLAGILRVQACDDQVCYPPGVINVVIPVTIK